MDAVPDINTTTIPIACTLTADEARGQTLEWADLRALAAGIVALEGGVRMSFSASMVDAVEDLARRERACCAFLNITTSTVDDTLFLEISTDDPEALPVIHAVAGIAP